ncbi:DUF2726 domain-containing protein [Candidatus Parcubacteria bacterium]|nr:MAG: DUF2726 domain-containing protein [Candidatus Parcubacteria bacterium]
MNESTEKQGCLSVLLSWLPLRRPEESFPYRLRDDFLSPAELSFYKTLCLTLGDRFTVQSKVRLADIFFVAQPDRYMAHFNRISQKHVDFLVCDASTMKPILGIELDDRSHSGGRKQQRDEFVENVFRSANLPLLRFPAQRQYNSRDIMAQIEPYLEERTSPRDTSQALTDTDPAQDAAPLCPKCGVPMVLRTATRGEHKGKQFYGCPNYPRCREVKPVPER